MRISMLHRLIATACIEEILAYLDHIRDFWSSLVASDPGSMKRIDLDTVDALQLLAPGKSRTDAKTACGLILGGQAFAEFSDEERRIIWNRMENFDGLVPSLYTFFEDFKYLESCAHCVKRLFGPSAESVWKTMSLMFIPSSDSDTQDSVIQTSESIFWRERATDAEHLDMGYLQVWLYAMRHYPLMPPDPKNDDDLLAKPTRTKADERAIYEMAELARRVGFKSPEIEALIDSSPDHQIARAALLQARKPNYFRYDAEQFNILIGQIVDCFAAAVPDQSETIHELLADSTVKPRARCGMPQMRTHKQDSSLLFLDRLHADDVEVADTITTFFVRRCVYFAFFGKPVRPRPTDSDHAGESPGDIPPRSPLFVREDEQSGDLGSALPAAPSRELSEQEQGEPQGLLVRRDGEQKILRSQQLPRSQRARRFLQRRRTRRVQTRRPRIDPMGEGNQDPMEIEWLSTEHSDQDMEEVDTYSQSTMISIGSAPLERDSENILMIEGPHHDGRPQEQMQIDHPSQPQSSESREGDSSGASPGGQQQVLETYLDQLMRTQEEQERLEEELERERLEEQLGISNQDRPVLELSPKSQARHISLPRPPDDQPVEVTHSMDLALAQPTQEPPAVSHRDGHPEPLMEDLELTATRDDTSNSQPVRLLLPPELVEISFWSFEREGLRESDRVQVDPSDPSPVERLAKKYIRKGYTLYDMNLQCLSPTQCYRAAIVDGHNKVFLLSVHEEQKLTAEGRLSKDRQLVSLAASRVLDRDESEPRSPTRQRLLLPGPDSEDRLLLPSEQHLLLPGPDYDSDESSL